MQYQTMYLCDSIKFSHDVNVFLLTSLIMQEHWYLHKPIDIHALNFHLDLRIFWREQTHTHTHTNTYTTLDTRSHSRFEWHKLQRHLFFFSFLFYIKEANNSSKNLVWSYFDNNMTIFAVQMKNKRKSSDNFGDIEFLFYPCHSRIDFIFEFYIITSRWSLLTYIDLIHEFKKHQLKNGRENGLNQMFPYIKYGEVPLSLTSKQVHQLQDDSFSQIVLLLFLSLCMRNRMPNWLEYLSYALQYLSYYWKAQQKENASWTRWFEIFLSTQVTIVSLLICFSLMAIYWPTVV